MEEEIDKPDVARKAILHPQHAQPICIIHPLTTKPSQTPHS
jgi:hypothetical protein